MPRPRTYEIDDALDRALELFSKRGYHDTSIEAIAAHLKLSRSTIYSTFRSKPALFLKALRQYTGSIAPGLNELNGAGSPRAALLRVLEVAAGGGSERHPRALYLLIEAFLVPERRNPKIAKLVEETFRDMEGRLRGVIERGQEAGEIAAHVDPADVARVLLGLYLGLYVLTGSGAVEGEQVLGAVQHQMEALVPLAGPDAVPPATA